jgi:hypothetical protein
MWQELIVGAAVLVAGLYAAWAILPRASRRALVRRFRSWAGRPGRAAWAGTLADRLERGEVTGASGCRGCPAAERPVAKPGPTERDPTA